MDGNFTIASACGDFTTFSCRLREVRRQDRLRQQRRELPNHCFYRHDGGPYCVRDDAWVLDDDAFVSLARGASGPEDASRFDDEAQDAERGLCLREEPPLVDRRELHRQERES